jgi:hypothetical protein
MKLKQTVYDHNGSRIWLEDGEHRKLLVDTYPMGTSDFATEIMDFVRLWIAHHKEDK